MKKMVKKPLVVLAIGVLLLLGSSVGATRAAVIYQDNAREVDFRTSNLEVNLLEGINVNNVNTITNGGALKFPGIPEDGINIGQKYSESIVAKNSSDKFNEYIRVKVRKYWGITVGEGDNAVVEKNTALDPELIELSVKEGWFKNEAEHTPEMDVYYYTKPVAAGSSVEFIDGVTISDTVTRVVETEPSTKDGASITGTIHNVYLYDNAQFFVEVELDAVQSHNGAQAIYGAWGVKAECDAVDDGKITNIEGVATK